MEFDISQTLFRADKIRELSQDPSGLRYLKLRSLSRGPTLLRLFKAAEIPPIAKTAGAMFREAFDSAQISLTTIDATIRELYEEQRAIRRLAEPELVSQLYRLQEFHWGGLHQNSLEKTIVDNYVKKITSYDALSEKIDNELQTLQRWRDARRLKQRAIDAGCLDGKSCLIVGPTLEIVRPLDRDVTRARQGLRGTFVLMTAICGSLLVLSAVILVTGNRRRRRLAAGQSVPPP